MFSNSSMPLQLFAVAATFCQVFIVASDSPTSLSASAVASHLDALRFFLGVDEAMWDALSEAALAIAVFAVSSVILRVFRRRGGRRQDPKVFVTKGTVSSCIPGLLSQLPSSKKVGRARPPFKSSQTDSSQAQISADGANCTANHSVMPKVLGTPAPQKFSRAQPALSSPGKQSDADFIAAAIRAGKASQLPSFLDSAYHRAACATNGDPTLLENSACELLLVTLRACAASRAYKQAVAAYDHMVSRVGNGNSGLWSILLYNIVEAGAFHRCRGVFQSLCKESSPSGNDFVNMFRCYAGEHDPEGLRLVLDDLGIAGHSIDAYTLNRALAACGNSSHALCLAETLVHSQICAEGMDAVGFNTVMKCNARCGHVARCFELRDEMLAKGLELSEVTFGILLDACVGAKEPDRARHVFNDLCRSGLRLNVVHCTTFLKGLIGAGHLDEAARVLQEMSCSAGVKPDLIAYSTLVKAYAEVGNVTSALKVLEQMIQEDVKPDEIIFNSVLTACCSFPLRSGDVINTFDTLIRYGLLPTTTTLSILLKALALTDAHMMSLRVLQEAPTKFGFTPELRLHTQLVRACIKARDGKAARKVFDAMVEASFARGQDIEPAEMNRLIRSCALEGHPDLAADLQQAAQKAGIAVQANTDKFVKATMSKKHKGTRMEPLTQRKDARSMPHVPKCIALKGKSESLP